MGKQKGRDEYAAAESKAHQAKVAQAVTTVITPAVTQTGLALEDVKLVGAGNTQALRITLDLPETETGALDSDRLGEVSRAISAALDADDVVPGAYNLEVSTPGATRPLTAARHYRRARGRLVNLELQDGTAASGRVLAVSDDDDPVVTLGKDADKTIELALSKVRKGKVELELNRLADGDFGAEVDDDYADIEDDAILTEDDLLDAGEADFE